MSRERSLPLTILLMALATAPAGGRAAGPASERAASSRPTVGVDFLEQYAATHRFQLGQPTAIQPTPEGDAVLFLRSGARSFVQDLIEHDVATGGERVLMTAERILAGGAENLTAAEKARRERMRVAARGIVSFKLSEDGQRILVPLAGRLFVVERASGAVKELRGAPGFPLDPQLSPDGALVACVRDGDLHVIDVAGGGERRLTTGAGDTLTHGLAEFIAQEEMSRFTGYWWSPDSRAIAYQTTNLAPVEVLHIADPSHPEKKPQAWRYPRPGTPNAEVGLAILPISGGAPVTVRWDRGRYPYLCAVRWSRNAPLTLLVQNRHQTEEALLAVDVATGATRTLLVERDAIWLNLDKSMPRWLDDGSGFLWTTERRGSWQLELRGKDGRLVREITPVAFNLRSFVDVDERGRRVWVMGGADPTQLQLFRAPLDRAGQVEPAGGDPGRHAVVFSRRHQIRVDSWSGMEPLPRHDVLDAGGRVVGALRSVTEEPLLRPRPSFVTVGARRYQAMILRPSTFRAGERYPVIVSVYGGPHSQQVVRSARSYFLQQWLAEQGYLVVSIDGRGTPGRGRAWERAIRGNLIEIPLADQVEGLQALAAEVPEMDLARMGIYGWSFGGYFAAHAAMQRPDVFRAGVAGAPVADWRDYDTYYTERYMGLPDANPRGYASASALTHAAKLERPLLIVHGTVDDNVYFLHSMKLSDALFRAGKSFEFLPLAGFTHMVPDPLVTRRLYGRIADFFDQHLRGADEGSDGGVERLAN